MKKILLLGGTYGQVYSIQTAKRLGYYTITCDNRPNNPGHKFADEYHQVSLLERDNILKLAKKLKIDGIISYALDDGANVAAYVAEKLGLPGQPLKSVEILTHKDLFRKFLLDNKFNSPKACGYSYDNIDIAIKDWVNTGKDIVIKPVDNGAARGISKINSNETAKYRECIEYALSFSRCRRFIIEEFINAPQLEGDLFSINGKLRFICLGNEYFKNFSIIGTTFPNNINKNLYNKMQNEIQRIINLLNMKTGVYSTEIQYTNDDIMMMEFTPRNGGIFIPQTIRYATGVDLAEYTIKAALNDHIDDLEMIEPQKCCAFYNLHSNKDGILKEIKISDELISKNVIELNIFKKIGDKVEPFYNLSNYIGNIIMKFSSQNEMHYTIQNMDKYIKVIVE